MLDPNVPVRAVEARMVRVAGDLVFEESSQRRSARNRSQSRRRIRLTAESTQFVGSGLS